MKKILKLFVIIVVIGVVVLALSQLIVAPLKTNPPVVSEPKWDSPQTRALAVCLLRLSQQRDGLAVVLQRAPHLVAGRIGHRARACQVQLF